jgi:dual specificity tyrosine-phosphorylation-regulated kinase 2/3/4
VLEALKENDPNNEKNIIRIKDNFSFRNHICITFELLSINMYDLIKDNNFEGFSMDMVRKYATQILQGLKYMRNLSIIHCDLKPENILMTDKGNQPLKIIDFGSSCFENERVYTYIQSRFYRAPEIILGIPYTNSIDMWSFACIIVELYIGFPIFPGESENDQLARIMEYKGIPPINVMEEATRSGFFFDENLDPLPVKNSRGGIRRP